MPKERQDPYKGYTIADWKWEFLRRNPRYIKAYRAIEWLKRRKNGCFFGFGRVARHLELLRWLGQQLGLDPEVIQEQTFLANEWSLPAPDMPAHKFECCPIKGSHILFDHEYLALRGSEEPLPAIDYLADHEVTVLIDTRSGSKEIIAELKVQLRPYQAKQRKQVKKYRDYLAVWDLRQKGLTADAIAPKLWPEEYENIGGRDSDTGEKGALIQRVYDYEKAAQRLIEESFPRRKRSPKIKK